MSREAMLITVGILVALSPFSGLPHTWLSIILPFLGVVAAGIGYSMRAAHVRMLRQQQKQAAPSELAYVQAEINAQPSPSRVA